MIATNVAGSVRRGLHPEHQQNDDRQHDAGHQQSASEKAKKVSATLDIRSTAGGYIEGASSCGSTCARSPQ